jgi:predicted RecB family nuclease
MPRRLERQLAFSTTAPTRKLGGALSLLKYKDAVDPNKSPAEQKESIEWLNSYNLDDVRATFAVRDFLRNLTF